MIIDTLIINCHQIPSKQNKFTLERLTVSIIISKTQVGVQIRLSNSDFAF